jgi:putative membrane protein (TIGR04086 family)
VEQRENKGKKQKKKMKFGWLFAGIVLLTLVVTAAGFLFWAWVSYRMRFSAEVIRAGLLSLYILPCLFGGKMLSGTRCGKPLLWGAALGLIFSLFLFMGSVAASFFMEGVLPEPDQTWVLPLLLCVLSGMFGALWRKKTASNP